MHHLNAKHGVKNFKLQQEAIFHSFLALEYEMLSNFFKFRDIKKKKKKNRVNIIYKPYRVFYAELLIMVRSKKQQIFNNHKHM